MGIFYTSLIYQNLLFAEGLESILQHNNHKVIKNELSEIKETTLSQLTNSELTIVEANWPFPQLEYIIDKIVMLVKDHSRIILISNLINKTIFGLVVNNKINGIVLKCSSKDELLFGIKQVMEGKKYYSSFAAQLFLRAKNETVSLTITKREKQILCLIAEMNTTEEIAKKLFITKSTVKTHRRNLMQKFNSKNTLCLLRTACRQNLLNTDNNFCGCCFKQLIEI